MGRPKGSKNKSTVAKIKTEGEKKATNVPETTKTTEITEVKKVPKADPKRSTEKYECELYGNPIYDSTRIIRCTGFTGFA